MTRAGQWFLDSGIQEANGGVARYYLADAQQNKKISTEITGYTVSTLAYLHSLTGERVYLERAIAGAKFLTREAWRADLDTMPFETAPTDEGLLAYYFDAGIIVRGLLTAWRATGDDEFLAGARNVGRAMVRDYATGSAGEYHPIVQLPERTPLARDLRWSRQTACYQLKSALGWLELSEATGDSEFRALYHGVLDFSLRTYESFLPGHPERHKVMDRLHAFSYFLEGMMPCAAEPRVKAALADGIGKVAYWLREIGPEFARSDVYAQLLRARLYAACLGAVPLDSAAADWEAAQLAEFQHSSADPRIHGGFYFARRGNAWQPQVNPVSTGFALQALAMARTGAPAADWRLLI